MLIRYCWNCHKFTRFDFNQTFGEWICMSCSKPQKIKEVLNSDFKEEENMKISKDKFRKEGEGTPFFKAEDMESSEVTVAITEYREIDLPNSGLTPVIDFNYQKEKRSLPLNKTNLGKLIEKLGDETDNWTLKKITLFKIKVTNPTTKKEVDGIRVKD